MNAGAHAINAAIEKNRTFIFVSFFLKKYKSVQMYLIFYFRANKSRVFSRIVLKM